VLAAEESGKRRIIQSLHNGLAQLLYATKLGLSQLNFPHLRDEPQAFAEVHHRQHLLDKTQSRNVAVLIRLAVNQGVLR
jgi:signal transduction histidine kinase